MSEELHPLAQKALAALATTNGSRHDGKVFTTRDIEDFVGCGHLKDGDPLLEQLHILARDRPPRIVSTSQDDNGNSWNYPTGYCWALPDTKGIAIEDHVARMAAESAKHKKR